MAFSTWAVPEFKIKQDRSSKIITSAFCMQINITKLAVLLSRNHCTFCVVVCNFLLPFLARCDVNCKCLILYIKCGMTVVSFVITGKLLCFYVLGTLLL